LSRRHYPDIVVPLKWRRYATIAAPTKWQLE
jgi:hypothetical protein